jgi:tetratricopeptide (TPR) repeat protein
VAAAAEQALEGVKLDADNADAQYNLGVALYTMGRAEDAIEALRVCVEIDSDFLDAQRQLADVLASEGRTEDAIQHYQEVLRIHPGDRRAIQKLETLTSGDQPETPPVASGGVESGGNDEAAPS